MTDQPDPPLPTPETEPEAARPRRRRQRAAAPAEPPDAPEITVAAPAADLPVSAPGPALAGALEAGVAEAPAEPASARSTGSLDTVVVERLDFERGAIGSVRATDVTARLVAVGGIAAGTASVERGFVSGVAARDATVRQGYVRGLFAQRVSLEQSFARSVVANTVQAGPSTGIGIALARRIDGEARILLDWRGALALGAVLGTAFVVARLARR